MTVPCTVYCYISRETANVVDAAAKGATEAIYVVFAVVASLIAFLSILHFMNAVIAYLGSLVDIQGLSLGVRTEVFFNFCFYFLGLYLLIHCSLKGNTHRTCFTYYPNPYHPWSVCLLIRWLCPLFWFLLSFWWVFRGRTVVLLGRWWD